MKWIVFLCVVVFSAVFSPANAQQRRLDSVLALNNAYHREDSVKAVYHRETFRAYYSIRNYAKMDLYVDSAISLASRLADKSILAFVYYRAGGVNHTANRFKAITYYNLSIETANANNYPKIEAGAYLNLGALYMDLREFPKSLEAHEKSIKYFAQVGNEDGVNSAYMNMSIIYVSMNELVKGMEYTKKALKAFEANGKSARGVAVASDAMADIYFRATPEQLIQMGVQPANRNKEITATLDKGLKNVLTTDDNSLTSAYYRQYGRLYESMGNLKGAQENYTKAVDYLKGDADEESFSDNLVLLGNFYVNRLKEYAKGMSMIHYALVNARKQKSSGTEEDALNALSNAHEKQRNFDSSLFYFRQAIVVKDSIYSREREQEVTRRQLKIDFDIKERDYKSAQQLADARMKQQEQQILLRNQQLQISDKEKTLQRLTFLQKQAELETEKKLQDKELVQEQQRAEFETKTRDQQIKVQNVQLTLNKRVSLFLGILAVIVIAVAMFIFKSRKKTVALNKIVSDQKDELQELVAVKDKIFSIVSHDMRTPVNNIIAFSSLVEDGDIEQERLAMYLEQIKGTLDHTSSLMENMLNWAASQMQGFTPVIEEVNLASVSQHIVSGVAPSLFKKKINCVNHVRENIFVKGDQNMVELIVRNLVNNAIKFSNPNGKIELSFARENNNIIFLVKDEGVGISKERMAAINNESSNAIQSTLGTGKEKGTGLGLMLCKHFARLMHGSIRVESEVGVGSGFVLSLKAAGS
jgi:signal transduction histidine kinase